jgi:hypothetical protein
MFIAALFTIAKLWKQPRYPITDEWIKKMWYFKADGNTRICWQKLEQNFDSTRVEFLTL